MAQLLAAYEGGETTPALAVRYGIAKASVLAVLRAHGVTVRRQSLTPAQVMEARQLYTAGLSLVRVAEQLGCDSSTVMPALRAAGVTLRDTQGRERTG